MNMDNKPQNWISLFSTPQLRVLDFMLQNPDMELNDTEITAQVRGVKRSAVNMALRALARMELTERKKRGRMTFNSLIESPFITRLKVISNLMLIQPLVNKLSPLCNRIILFGSRSEGTHTSESDIDLLIVSSEQSAILKIVRQSGFEDRIQLVIKKIDEWLSLAKDDTVFYNTVRKGIVLWEQI